MEEKDLKILSEAEIKASLKDLPGWIYENNKIRKEFVFDSFPDAVAFIENLTPFFQEHDHHPDIHVYYKKIVFELQRFSVGGRVTPRDFMIANEIEKRFKLK